MTWGNCLVNWETQSFTGGMMSKNKLRDKADRMLQDYIREKYKDELCYACGERLVMVGHHFVNKSASNALRFYLPNIIPLCKNCHCLVHCQPHLVEPKICFLMGKSWYEDLMTEKRRQIKTTKEWYETKIRQLTAQ